MTVSKTSGSVIPGRERNNPIPGAIKYIPSIFHAEAERDQSPLQALLLVMEYNHRKIEDIIVNIDRYFDVDETPAGEFNGEADFLSWLAKWVGMDLDPDWSTRKKRYAVKIAVDLHRYRGTPIGMEYRLALYFDIEVKVTEWAWPHAMQIGVRNTIGMDTMLFERPDLNACFVLTWEPGRQEMNKTEFIHKVRRIRAMIDREKPAHALCYFNVKGLPPVQPSKETKMNRDEHEENLFKRGYE